MRVLFALLLVFGFCAGDVLIPCRVVRVVDGDTLRCVPAGEKKPVRVRLVGIDALETQNRAKALRQARWFSGGLDTVFRFGKLAKRYAERLTLGRVVFLELSVRKKDKNGRLLAFVWLDEERRRMLNVLLLEEGLALLFILPPQVKYTALMGEAQERALAEGRGFWSFFRPR
ncbi:MAG: thermonuclease [Aquificae bacterium]|nr:thermonuclease [Aquificota bacterium]